MFLVGFEVEIERFGVRVCFVILAPTVVERCSG